ncbi:hypothetical protein LCGC14_2264360 [marine sediment metagenome]|uniref:Uncharacterized protein n=1 Tax=marine sediment metagenome TaxID=412755 RepID=A0A0F9FTS1_9ZZZZ
MKFNFMRWSNGEWAVQHPAARGIGFGATKFQAVRDLEAQVGKLSAR